MDGLALIASNLRMVHGISRHYGQPAALAAFLRKVANQLIKRSRQHILAPGKLWEQTDRPALVEALNSACRLHSAFAEHASALLGGGAATLGGSTASAGARLGTAASAGSAASAAAAAAAGEAAAAALAKYGLFAKRCAKLSEMFSTVHQFAQLAQHTHIEGVAAVLAKFSEVGAGVQGACARRVGCWKFAAPPGSCCRPIQRACCQALPARQRPVTAPLPRLRSRQVVEDIKKRPYDLLDFSRTQFDRDLLEFSVQINDLEAALQVGAAWKRGGGCLA